MTKRILTFIVVFAYCVVLGGQSLLSAFSVKASAAETSYSNVLDDLKKDSDFNVADYPAKADDYSLQVIQIAEGENGELFVYVYQPSTIKFEATRISMFNGYSDNGKDFSPTYYDLTLVSSSGVFYKYLVDNFTVSDDGMRFYNIVSIYRTYYSALDGESDVINDEIAFKVSQQWCCYYYNDTLIYEKTVFSVLEINVNVNSYARFYDGITLNSIMGIYDAGDAHFIAFDAKNYQIDHIYDAELEYKTRAASYSSSVGDYEYGDWSDFKKIQLTSTDTATKQGNGLFAKKYTWNRISTSADFVKNLEDQDITFVDTIREKTLASQFVFAFLETEYSGSSSSDLYQWREFTEVGSVGVLRIYFQDVNQKFYNLAVVGNLTTSTPSPGATGSGVDEDAFEDFFKWLTAILSLIVVLVIGSYIMPFIAPLISFVINGVGFILKFLLRIITLPFRLVGNLFAKK